MAQIILFLVLLEILPEIAGVTQITHIDKSFVSFNETVGKFKMIYITLLL